MITTTGFNFSPGKGADLSSVRSLASVLKPLQFVDGKSMVPDDSQGLAALREGLMKAGEFSAEGAKNAGATLGEGLRETGRLLAGGITVAATAFADGVSKRQDNVIKEKAIEADKALAERKMAIDEGRQGLADARYANEQVIKAQDRVADGTTQALQNAKLELDIAAAKKKGQGLWDTVNAEGPMPTAEDQSLADITGLVPSSIDPSAKGDATALQESQDLVPPMTKEQTDKVYREQSQERQQKVQEQAPPFKAFPIIVGGKDTGMLGIIDATGNITYRDRPTTKAATGDLSETQLPPGFEPTGVSVKDGNVTKTFKPEDKSPGKELSSEMVQRMANFRGVRDTLAEIKLKLTNIEERGPAIGRLREVNPYDLTAQELTKQVESIVPGLARSVFGEVGVLTDSDVRRYKEMVPNMKTDRDVADSLIKLLEDKINSSETNFIDTAEQAGYNVSGFRKAQEKAKSPEQTESDKKSEAVLGQIKTLRSQIANLSLVDKNRAAAVQQLKELTQVYVAATGKPPTFGPAK